MGYRYSILRVVSVDFHTSWVGSNVKRNVSKDFISLCELCILKIMEGSIHAQRTFTYSKSAMETLEHCANLLRINNKDIGMTFVTTWDILERKLQGWFLINPMRHETLNICLEILRSGIHGLFKETRLTSVTSTGFA